MRGPEFLWLVVHNTSTQRGANNADNYRKLTTIFRKCVWQQSCCFSSAASTHQTIFYCNLWCGLCGQINNNFKSYQAW